ncbi:MAG TPA: DUF4880 domain-containing protein [Nitrobacter sp.]|nr:DUF4880 domain-containing protein [Nitrobacter sp.]
MDESGNPDVISERAASDARDWVVRLSSGRMTEAELARFKAWRAASEENARAFIRERAFWRQLGALDLQAGQERAPRQPAFRGARWSLAAAPLSLRRSPSLPCRESGCSGRLTTAPPRANRETLCSRMGHG